MKGNNQATNIKLTNDYTDFTKYITKPRFCRIRKRSCRIFTHHCV